MASKTEAEDVCKRVGSRIRELRRERGWTQIYLAEVTGMSKTYLSNLETGQKEPCLKSLEMVAQAFEMSLGQFFRPI